MVDILDLAVRSYGLMPSRADRCTYVYYGIQIHVENVPALVCGCLDHKAKFNDVDVGVAWRCLVISETQGPIYLSCFSIGKSELGPGRDVLVGDEVFLA